MASRFIMPTADVGKGLTPSDGAKLSFFITGTSTPKDTFTTEAATVPNSNPVIADSNGVFPDIFIKGTYKVTLTDKNDVQSGFGEADPVSETVGVGEPNIQSLTLAQAVSLSTAIIGQIVQITDQGDGQFTYVLASSVIPNTFNIIQCTGSISDLALVLRVVGEPIIEQFGGAPGYEQYLLARETHLLDVGFDLLLVPEIEQPKLLATSELIGEGKSKKGFVSACRHNDDDYVFFRAGFGHLEATPITNTSELRVSIRGKDDQNPPVIHAVHQPASADPRDPNVLRDNFGNAILVGGLMKVVFFEWVTDYATPSNATAYVMDFDPASPAAGFTNKVAIPTTIRHVRSDVRQLSGGNYSFVGYTSDADIFQVTTSDWINFSFESIGKGNEAAFCETPNGDLNAIVRGEEAFGVKTTVWYKKPSGGSWVYYRTIEETIDAPTLTRVTPYVRGSAANAADGWILLGRRKTQRFLDADDMGGSQLICYRSKNDNSQELTEFEDFKILMDNGVQRISNGDSHYCSAIADGTDSEIEVGKGRSITIYTYAAIDPNGTSTTSLIHSVWKLTGSWDSQNGVVLDKANGINEVVNGNFTGDSASWSFDDVASTVSLNTEINKNTAKIIGIPSPSLRGNMVTDIGRVYFGVARLRFNTVVNSERTGLLIKILNAASAVIQSTTIDMPNETFGTDWHIVPLLPFNATESVHTVQVLSNNANMDVEFDYVSFSDNYHLIPPIHRDLKSEVHKGARGSAALSTGSGTSNGTAVFSIAFWAALFPEMQLLDSRPALSRDPNDLVLSLVNARTGTETIPVIMDSIVVESDWSISMQVSVNQAYSGTLSTLNFDPIVTLRVNK
jgi:hypothetical protein